MGPSGRGQCEREKDVDHKSYGQIGSDGTRQTKHNMYYIHVVIIIFTRRKY